MSDDPLDQPDKLPAWSWKDKPVGTSFTGEITEEPKLVQSRDFDTGDPAFWDDGNPKMSLVIGLNINGEDLSYWAPKPSASFAALIKARKEAGESLRKGGKLWMKLTERRPIPDKPKLNPQNIVEARYQPPTVVAGDPLDDEPPPF